MISSSEPSILLCVYEAACRYSTVVTGITELDVGFSLRFSVPRNALVLQYHKTFVSMKAVEMDDSRMPLFDSEKRYQRKKLC